MSHRARPLVLVASLLLAAACAPVEPEGETESPTPPDFGEEAEVCRFDEVTMNALFTVTPQGEPGSERHLVTGEYHFIYYLDRFDAEPLCTQVVAFEGEAFFGEGVVEENGGGACPLCTGQLQVDPLSIVDRTDPVANPGECTAANLVTAGYDWGLLLTTPVSQTTFGDFLAMALVDAGTQETEELSLRTIGDDTDVESLTEKWAERGSTYVGGGYLRTYDGSLAMTACTFLSAAPPGPEADYLAGWEVTRAGLEAELPWPMAGEYEAEAMIGLRE